MKNTMLFLAALALCLPAAGQVVEPPTEEHNQFLKRVRTQKTIATAAAVTGGALVATGGMIYLGQMGAGRDGSSANIGEALALTGVGLVLVSSLFIEPTASKGRLWKALPATPFVEVPSAPRHRLPMPGKRAASFGFRFGF